ncbi:hypothetical protein V8F20_002942 [Naviculisporaceae sp. PSN 640]
MAQLLYNPISAQCTVMPCINQVAGYVDHNPVAQLSACQSLFGLPLVATVTQTVPADDVFSTRTSTSTDVVIVVTTSTAYSTAEQTSTVFETLYSTTMEYTRTVTNTLSATITATPTPPAKNKKKRKVKRRGACKPKSSSITSHSSSTAAPTSAQPPIPSNCANLAEYSSACACIEPRTVTEYADSVTSIVDETTTVVAASTIGTVVTVGITTVVVQPATTTIPTTLKTQTATTTTATTTVTPIPTIFNLKIYNTNEYLYISANNQGMALQIGTTPQPSGLLQLAPGTGNTPTIRGAAAFPMWGYSPVGGSVHVSRVIFQMESYAGTIAGTWSKATCGINTSMLPGNLYFYCNVAQGQSFFRCGADVYLTNNVTPSAECSPIILTAVGV